MQRKYSRMTGGRHRERRDRKSTCTRKEISHYSDSQRAMKVASRKHSIFILFSRKTKIARPASEPRLRGLLDEGELEIQYFEQKFGDLITADHKVFNEGSESRHDHRYSVVAQDLATQWILSYPCRTKNSQETHAGVFPVHTEAS